MSKKWTTYKAEHLELDSKQVNEILDALLEHCGLALQVDDNPYFTCMRVTKKGETDV